ncbi:MAG: biopolymer transporter ExbD [Pseudomonadota bacterium]
MKRLKRSSERDPVISLINIVFLILIFFMVAGTLESADRDGLSFVQTSGLECCQDGDALVITQTGELRYAGEVLPSLDAYVGRLNTASAKARLLPDQSLPALTLLQTITDLRAAGIKDIVVVTEDQRR